MESTASILNCCLFFFAGLCYFVYPGFFIANLINYASFILLNEFIGVHALAFIGPLLVRQSGKLERNPLFIGLCIIYLTFLWAFTQNILMAIILLAELLGSLKFTQRENLIEEVFASGTTFLPVMILAIILPVSLDLAASSTDSFLPPASSAIFLLLWFGIKLTIQLYVYAKSHKWLA